jgi:hypothetical protein
VPGEFPKKEGVGIDPKSYAEYADFNLRTIVSMHVVSIGREMSTAFPMPKALDLYSSSPQYLQKDSGSDIEQPQWYSQTDEAPSLVVPQTRGVQDQADSRQEEAEDRETKSHQLDAVGIQRVILSSQVLGNVGRNERLPIAPRKLFAHGMSLRPVEGQMVV